MRAAGLVPLASQARPALAMASLGVAGPGSRQCSCIWKGQAGRASSKRRLTVTQSRRRTVLVSSSNGDDGSSRKGRGGSGSGGNGSKSSSGGDGVLTAPSPRGSLKAQLEILGMLLVRYPGIIGSLAVAGGYFLHINALPMHWDSHDALLGLQCAAPILLLDALLMLPDWSPATTTKTIKLKAPKSVADKLKQSEAAKAGGEGGAAGVVAAVAEVIKSTTQTPGSASGPVTSGALLDPDDMAAVVGAAPAAAAAVATAEAPDEELVEVERTISVRADQPPLIAALHRLQTEKATSNVGRLLSFPLEVVLMLTWHLAEEMLYRAVILTWAAGWTIDRLYEAGADEVVNVLGMQLATPQAGALFAAIGCTTASLAILVQQAFFPLKLIGMAEEELTAQEGSAAPAERERMRKVLAKVKGRLTRQRRWSTAVEGVRDVAEWASYSTSFLLTGNLLAPYLTAVTSDLLFSSWQRLKAGQVERRQLQAWESIRELHGAAMALKDARKAALQPPPLAERERDEGDSVGSSGTNGGSAPEVPGKASSSSGGQAEGDAAETRAAEGSKHSE